jgi:hypothetical protein
LCKGWRVRGVVFQADSDRTRRVRGCAPVTAAGWQTGGRLRGGDRGESCESCHAREWSEGDHQGGEQGRAHGILGAASALFTRLPTGARVALLVPLAGGLGCVCAYGRRTPTLAWSRWCPWAAGIVGMRRSASHSMCVAWCVWVRLSSAHTGTRLVTAVPLGRWHCWNAAVSSAQYVRCLVCLSLPAAALSSDSEAGDSVPWHRTYRYWSKPETGHHCLWSSLLSNKPAVALKPVIACLGTGLIGGEASLRKGTTAPGPLFLQIVRMGGER